ncbi:AraC family transcriptional regulator [Compostibacter hankyongensis]|uniref:Response regulator transcription factor n=1 Tax=Compostibacter hankyongensis TaxID=1007089 RepID=A0ABP8FMG4_9BACT
METIETLAQYYEMTCRKLPVDLQRGDRLTRHFNVFRRNKCFGIMPFRRRDYYKISLCRGDAVLYTDKGEVKIDYPAIFFSNPAVKFGWHNISKEQQGFVCLFNELYVNAELKQELKRLDRLFEGEVYSFVKLTDEQYGLLSRYFTIMLDEYNDAFEFIYKEDVIQHILRLILYTTMKIYLSSRPGRKEEKQHMIVSRFIDLLDGQFPVDSPRHPIQLITPSDFASHLHIHVNHLNHLIKHYSGKPTSRLILEKRLSEAISLLRNTDWSIAEIAESLGFAYPQYFNHFFKTQTGMSPREYRRVPEGNI